MLSKDYPGLVKAFMATGFIGTPIEWRPKDGDPWQLTHPDGPSDVVRDDRRWRASALAVAARPAHPLARARTRMHSQPTTRRGKTARATT